MPSSMIGSVVAGVHHAVDVVERDISDSHFVELDAVGRHHAVGGRGEGFLSCEIINAEALGLGAAQRDKRGAGVDQDAHRNAVDHGGSEEVSLAVRGKNDAANA